MSDHQHVCPWWVGYLLASPVRRLAQNPQRILAPFVREGMTVLEPGPGMGFFTLDLARLTGSTGRVIAIEIQPKMLRELARRAQKAGLADRIEFRQPDGESMNVDDLAGRVDFILAAAVVHELPSRERFFREAYAALKVDGKMLLAEPRGHVNAQDWDATLNAASAVGLHMDSKLTIRRSHASLLSKGTWK